LEPIFEESHRVDRAISRAAHRHGADLIIMSSRGRTRAAGIVHASRVEHAIRHSRASFLVLKTQRKPIGLMKALWERISDGCDLQFS
jgi:nucleotide-binding universal stress UspA family protein